MVLWRQGTYFGVESSLKPLLHAWSLSIEEQYYFLLPAILVFIPSKYWLRTIVVALLLSILICFSFYQIQAGAAFYLFPARAWELCIGSLGVFIHRDRRVTDISVSVLIRTPVDKKQWEKYCAVENKKYNELLKAYKVKKASYDEWRKQQNIIELEAKFLKLKK